MALPKIKDARALSDEELQAAIIATKKELFDLRFQKATRQLEKTHEFKHKKHRLAQLMTVEGERMIAASQAVLADEAAQDSDVQSVNSDVSEGGEE
ncbi:MAG: 50S ribosomal protein L29 [Leptolyngbyaceae bacterium]|nr:50S ribosomal protein L29 [Leptolyngbyaceae bacterium]